MHYTRGKGWLFRNIATLTVELRMSKLTLEVIFNTDIQFYLISFYKYRLTVLFRCPRNLVIVSTLSSKKQVWKGKLFEIIIWRIAKGFFPFQEAMDMINLASIDRPAGCTHVFCWRINNESAWLMIRWPKKELENRHDQRGPRGGLHW